MCRERERKGAKKKKICQIREVASEIGGGMSKEDREREREEEKEGEKELRNGANEAPINSFNCADESNA